MKRQIASLTLKSLLVISFAISMTAALSGGFSGLLFFTYQSNIWIGLTSLAALIAEIISLVTKKEYELKIIRTLKYIFTVSITLTFIVFAILLAPMIGAGAFAPTSLFMHYIVPLLSIADLLINDYKFPRSKLLPVLALAPPLGYLFFSLIAGENGIIFPGGNTYPYFFLDYKGLGWFSVTEKGLGVAYWIIIMLLFVFAIAVLYYALTGLRKRGVEKRKTKNPQPQT